MATSVATRPLLTKADLARLLRCSPRTIDRLRASGKLRAVQFKRGGRVLYRPEDVEALLAEDLEWQ